MSIPKVPSFALPVLAGFVVFFTRCTNFSTSDGGTETGNPAVTAMLYNTDGSPAVGVRVYIRPKTTLADTSGLGLTKRMTADTASVVTDDSGRFVIDSIDTGTYVIEAASGNNAVFIDSVPVSSQDSTVELPPDTLKPAGALKGVIYLSEGGDRRKVFILAFGIDRFAPVDSLGAFRFRNLAEAAYNLRIISSLDDYGVLDLPNVTVITADTANLDTIALPFEGIPTPKGLSLSYDTLKQFVTLTWNMADTGLVYGYNVYRQHVDSGLVKINSAVITDTIFMDSTAIQDQSYTYKVKAVDNTGNEGLLSEGADVEAVSAYLVTMSIDSINGSSFKPFGLFIDTNRLFIADSWAKKIIEIDLDGNFISEFGSEGDDSGKFTAPNDIAIDGNGNYWIADFGANKIQKIDQSRNFLESWSLVKNGASDSVAIIEPTKLAIDYSNTIYILMNSADWQIIKINDQGLLLADWAIGGNRSIGIDVDTENRLVTSPDGSEALFFIDSGTVDKTVNLSIYGAEKLAIGLDGLIYTHNPQSGEIIVFGSDGRFLIKWSALGDSGGDMDISSTGEILLGTIWPGKVQKFTRR